MHLNVNVLVWDATSSTVFGENSSFVVIADLCLCECVWVGSVFSRFLKFLTFVFQERTLKLKVYISVSREFCVCMCLHMNKKTTYPAHNYLFIYY